MYRLSPSMKTVRLWDRMRHFKVDLPASVSGPIYGIKLAFEDFISKMEVFNTQTQRRVLAGYSDCKRNHMDPTELGYLFLSP